jgi:hypothetical protein
MIQGIRLKHPHILLVLAFMHRWSRRSGLFGHFLFVCLMHMTRYEKIQPEEMTSWVTNFIDD